MHQIILDLQIACAKRNRLPDKIMFINWLKGMMPFFLSTLEITIRIVNKKESCTLNGQYRGRYSPTNVLSFPFEPSFLYERSLSLLGDIVICRDLIEEEAKNQGKILEAHWAHMVIHGALHLLGYNHIHNPEKKDMEKIEIQILKALGYQNPYD